MIARSLNAPELTAPPLADKPIGAAIDTLCDDLGKRSDWRRLLQVLQLRSSAQLSANDKIEQDTISALRSFLAGQNLELAEQWSDAAQAYKAVLRTAAERSPTKAAADRLKALAKNHPGIFGKSPSLALATPAK